LGELREAIRWIEDGCAWGSTALRGLGDVFARRNGALRRRLLATSSLVALIVGGSAAAHAACVSVPSSGGFTNATGSTIPCIIANSATTTGNVVNAGTITPGSPTGTGIAINSTVFNGSVINSGSITVNGAGIFASGVSIFSGGISNSNTISATGAGIVVSGVSSFSGGITSSGKITAGSTGIVVSGVSSFSGGITNSGKITAGSTGIVVSGVSSFSGGITNAGTITARVGMFVGTTSCGCGAVQTFSGGLTNSGTISAAHAGILVSGVSSFSGGITNAGTITHTGAISGGPRFGILVGTTRCCSVVQTFSGGVTNSGAITARTGIAVAGVSLFSGGVTNSGGITAARTGIVAVGVSSFSGAITNSNTITAGAGIVVVDVSNSSGGITNTGTISAGSGPGIVVARVSNFSGGITNTGTINTGPGPGIFVTGTCGCGDQTFAGGITNTGTINASSAIAGIFVAITASFAGGITNAGTINSGPGPSIFVTGVCGCGQTFAGGITNTGTINASAGFAGIFVTNMASFAGGIANSGTITGGADGIIVAGVSSFSDGITNNGKISAATFGVVVAGVSSFAGGIFNSGTIVGHTGIVVAGGTRFSGAIANTGNIIGTGGIAIDVSNAPNAMTIDQQAGTIAGAVKLSAFGDTFTMTGGTMVGVVTAGGTIGGIIGQGNGTANFALGSGTQVFGIGSAITGIGALNISSGKVVLNDAGNLVVGTTSIGGGLLQIGDAAHPGAMLDSPLVTVGAGGTLEGHGTVVGAILVGPGGTLSPGGSIGTLTVNGSASFGAGSTYRVEVNPAGQSDNLAVTGATTLSGGTLQVLAPIGHYAPGTQYVILTSQGGVTGTFADATSNSIFIVPTLSYTPTAIDLTLTGLSFTSAAATPNQGSVAGALDRLPSASPIFAAIFNIGTFAQARQAFDALSGEIHASLQTTLIDDSRYPRQAMLGRMRQATYADQAGDLAALAFGGPEPGGAGLAYQDPHPWPVKAPAPPIPGPDIAYWAQAFGAWGHIDGDGNAAREQRNLAGFMTGVDARIGPLTRVGIAAGYTHSSVNLDARASSAGVDTAQLGAYAQTSLGGFNLRTGAAYGFHTIDTNRTIAFPGFLDAAAARYDGGTAQLFGEVGYGLMMGPVAVEPVAGLGLVRLHTDGFSETGGPTALSAAGNNDSIGYSSLGLRAATAYQLAGGMVVMPRAALAWQHAIGEVTPSAALAFRDAGIAFAVAGVPLARDSALVEAGLDLRLNPHAKVGLSYSGELASKVQDHAVKGNFVWAF
jgi:outer membrane autotransporter protein